MLRRLAHGFVVSLLLTPALASALGLGNIDTRSALNEPLDARIPLSATEEELENLRVGLASADAYQRANLDRPFFLSRLIFDVVVDDGPTPYLRVSTESAVREPFVSFLVEVRWTGGRLLREYTLLLDPPVFTPRQQSRPPTRTADSAAPSSQPSISDARSTSGRPAGGAGASAAAAGASGGSEYGPVRRNDTAWDIAMSVRPDSDVSVHQMMMALVRANPNAFPDGNVNNLRAGAILRIPSRADIMSLSAAEARREFASQVESWRSGRPTASAQPAVAASEPVAPEQDDGRLQVLAASDRSGSDATASMDTDSETANSSAVRQLQEELSLREESEAELRSENEELRQMADEMRQRIQALERTINLPGETRFPSESPVADTPDVAPLPDVEPDFLSDSDRSVDAASELPLATEPERPVERQISSQPAVPDIPAEPVESELQPSAAATPEPEPLAPWQDPRIQMYGGGVFLALLALLLLIMRRRRQAMDEDDYMPDMVMGEESGEVSDMVNGFVGGAAVGSAASAADGESAGDAALEQAETYMGLGHYDQAADAIAVGLAADPDNTELRLKLLEIHALNDDRGAFEAEAQELYALVDGDSDPVWERASELGRDVAPENPLFSNDEDYEQSLLKEVKGLEEGNSLDDLDADAHVDADTGADVDADADVDVDADAEFVSAKDNNVIADMEQVQEQDDLSDLDFAMSDDPEDVAPTRNEQSAASAAKSANMAADEVKSDDVADDGAMDFDLDSIAGAADKPAASEKAASPEPVAETDEDDFSLDFESSQALADDKKPTSEKPQTDSDADFTVDEVSNADDPDMQKDAGTTVAMADSDDADDADDDALFENGDENGTKLDLARAYLDMGDAEGARSLLEEVIEEGDEDQKQEARTMFEKAG